MRSNIVKSIAMCLVGVFLGYYIGANSNNQTGETISPTAPSATLIQPTPAPTVAAKPEKIQAPAPVAVPPETENLQLKLAMHEKADKKMHEAYGVLLKNRESYTNYRLLKRRQAENKYRPFLDLLGIPSEKRTRVLDAMAGREMEVLEFNAVASSKSSGEAFANLRLANKETTEQELAKTLTAIIGVDGYGLLKSFTEGERQWNSIVKFNAWLPDPELKLTAQQSSMVADLLMQGNSTLVKESALAVVGTALTGEQMAHLKSYIEEERRIASAWAEDDKIRKEMKANLGL